MGCILLTPKDLGLWGARSNVPPLPLPVHFPVFGLELGLEASSSVPYILWYCRSNNSHLFTALRITM